jgi:hypothetical protein
MPFTHSIASAIADPEAHPGQTPNPYTGRFFADQTYHFETLRTVGYAVSGGDDIGEVLETVKQITEGDAQSWFAAWAAASERVHDLAERTRDPVSKGDAYLRAQLPASRRFPAAAGRSEATELTPKEMLALRRLRRKVHD